MSETETQAVRTQDAPGASEEPRGVPERPRATRTQQQARRTQRRPTKAQDGRGAKAVRTTGAQAPKRAHGIWTPANIVTMIRIVFIPVWLLAAEAAPASDGKKFGWVALLVALFYMALALTDKLDGYLARSRGEVTTFGKFLDPIADKLIVLVALCFLLEERLVPSWVLLAILAREFLVSGLRMVIASKGVVVAASNLGKWKTAVTMVSICGFLLVRCLPIGWVYRATYAISQVTLIAAVVLTAWSGIDYFIKGRQYLLED